MRSLFIVAAMLPVLVLATPDAGGEDAEPASTPPASGPPSAENQEFKPPPGFRSRKRGEFVVYCRREEPKGSRFPTEVCYDEEGIRNMLQQQREDQVKVDQLRKTRAAGACCD